MNQKMINRKKSPIKKYQTITQKKITQKNLIKMNQKKNLIKMNQKKNLIKMNQKKNQKKMNKKNKIIKNVQNQI